MSQKNNAKILILCLLALVTIFVLCSCGSKPGGTENKSALKDSSVLEITEELFLTQVNDIYTNLDDYLGRKITYQGIFQTMDYEEDGISEQILYVFRNSPGCCGNDGTAGFEVVWDGEIPPQDSWVEVEGTLVTFEDKEGNQFLQLKLDSLTVMKERGKEFVSQ